VQNKVTSSVLLASLGQ